MPSRDWNLKKWNETWDWEGSKPGWCFYNEKNEADWRSMIMPRIWDFVPCTTILEIAPGHGRWTHFLKGLCQQLNVVDMAPNCIEACQKRFAEDKNICYYVNDGLDLSFLLDGQLDFAFSFDSLVHVDLEVIDSYLGFLARKLSKDGVGFFHHSNGAALSKGNGIQDGKIKGGRSTQVSAEIFEQVCHKYGLLCISQEIINWNSPEPIDCLSIFCRAGAKWQRENVKKENLNFRENRSLAVDLLTSYVFSAGKS